MRGRVWKFGDNIDTDQIYPGAYLTVTDENEMARYAMKGVEGRENFAEMVNEGDIIVAGKNFGCGSSREHAPMAIKKLGISCIIAKSFARIFYRNAINIGLPVIELKEADEINEGDELEVDVHEGIIRNLSTGKVYRAMPMGELERKIMEAGGLIEYLRGGNEG